MHDVCLFLQKKEVKDSGLKLKLSLGGGQAIHITPTGSRSPSPHRRHRNARSPLHISPMRFTPSPDEAPKTPSMSPMLMHSPAPSRSPSSPRASYTNRQPWSPAKTPSLGTPTGSSPQHSPLPPPPPPARPITPQRDVRAIAAAAKQAAEKSSVMVETSGTIIVSSTLCDAHSVICTLFFCTYALACCGLHSY